MSHFSKKFFVLAVLGLFSFSLAGTSFAASDTENSLTGFFKRLFNYPAKATQQTAGMTANALQNTGEKVVSKTGENTEAILKGNVAKTGDLVVAPVVGTAQTTGQAVSETAQIPVKAAAEEQLRNKKVFRMILKGVCGLCHKLLFL